MIAHQSDQQLWCQSTVFQVRKWPAMKAEDRVFRSISTERSQNPMSRLVSMASLWGFCVSSSACAVTRHVRATSCTWTLSPDSHPPAAFDGQSRLIPALHARTLSRPSPSHVGSTRLVDQFTCPGDPSSDPLQYSTTQPHLCFSTAGMPSKASTSERWASQKSGDAAHPNASSQEPDQGAWHTTGFTNGSAY